MTLLPMTEDHLQAAVIDLALLRGWYVHHDHDSRRNPGTAGFPDLFLLHPRTGQIVVAELKTARGVVSLDQRRYIDAFAAAGVTVHLWRPADLRSGAIASALTPRTIARPAACWCGMGDCEHEATPDNETARGRT